jgi:hypothetical protein
MFWLDWWWGSEPLATKFPSLFDICRDQTLLVNQALSNPRLNIQFRQTLSLGDLALWKALRTDLDACTISEGHDRCHGP